MAHQDGRCARHLSRRPCTSRRPRDSPSPAATSEAPGDRRVRPRPWSPRPTGTHVRTWGVRERTQGKPEWPQGGAPPSPYAHTIYSKSSSQGFDGRLARGPKPIRRRSEPCRRSRSHNCTLPRRRTHAAPTRALRIRTSDRSARGCVSAARAQSAKCSTSSWPASAARGHSCGHVAHGAPRARSSRSVARSDACRCGEGWIRAQRAWLAGQLARASGS